MIALLLSGAVAVSAQTGVPLAAPCVLAPNPVAAENCFRGTAEDAWGAPDRGRGELRVSSSSVVAGETVRFELSARRGPVAVELYRLGYYAGAGARLVSVLRPALGRKGGAASAVWEVPRGALSGLYVARLTGGGRLSRRAVFLVRDDARRADILVLAPRPERGLDELFSQTLPFARWLEANGYDAAYAWDEDVADRPGLLRGHRAALVVGRDDERSAAARWALQTAPAEGVSVLSFSGPSSCRGPLALRGKLYPELGCGGRSPSRSRSASGALVFDAGTPYWAWGLDNRHPGGSGAAAAPAVQQATVDILAEAGVEPGALQPGLAPASAGANASSR